MTDINQLRREYDAAAENYNDAANALSAALKKEVREWGGNGRDTPNQAAARAVCSAALKRWDAVRERVQNEGYVIDWKGRFTKA